MTDKGAGKNKSKSNGNGNGNGKKMATIKAGTRLREGVGGDRTKVDFPNLGKFVSLRLIFLFFFQDWFPTAIALLEGRGANY
jgi:hypothetical protein